MPVIKYCIWDVGNVIYNYTLEPVHDWCERRTADRETFLRNKGKFSYNNYMKGLVPYAELCRQLCDFYAVPYLKDYAIELNRAFRAGIKNYFPQTRQTQEELQQRGIANCILSNALPVLAGDNKAADIIPQERQFCSFDLGLLKPDPETYRRVREKLGCRFEELIFVDDKPKNTKAAAELGIHAVTFNPQTIIGDIRKIISPQKMPHQTKSR